MEGFLGNEAYKGNFENKNLDYHWADCRNWLKLPLTLPRN